MSNEKASVIIELYCSADLDVPQMDEIVADEAFSKAEQLLKVQQNIYLCHVSLHILKA